MTAGKIMRWMAVGLGLAPGCLGYPDPLPPPLGGSDEGTAGSTATSAADTTMGAATGETDGPIVGCGNDVVEDGEECDGTDPSGASCADLGLSGDASACVGCRLDASACGPPPGMVEVPGGVFTMGSDHPDADTDEQPVREVHVDAFWIDQTEVTVAAYVACMNAPDAPCSEPVDEAAGVECNWMIGRREDHPVNCLTWEQARAFCEWVDGGTKRLPTEAEWEKAARGTDARTYPWGEDLATCDHAVMDEVGAGGPGCGTSSTRPVGSNPMGVSPYGAYDMAGNAWEWVADWHALQYDDDETDNPTGPATGDVRVRRGGSYASNWQFVRAANRGYATEQPDPLRYVGARCARTPPGAG